MERHKLEIEVKEPDSSTCIFTVKGSLHGTIEGYAFQDMAREKIAKGARKVVIDLGSVKRIDSSGIGILIAIMYSAYKAGGALIVASLPPPVKTVLDLGMILDRMEQADTVDEALEKFARMQLPPDPV